MSIFYELNEKALAMERAGKRVIKLNIGDTNLPSPEWAVRTAEKSLRDKKHSYISSAGFYELREKIARREGCRIEEVSIGPGSKHILFALFSIYLKSGGKMVVPAPFWPAYKLIAGQLGAELVPVKTEMEKGWVFENLPLEGADLAVLCNPSNPTSTVYPEELIAKTVKEANEKGVPIILDEAYHGLAFKKIPAFDGCIRVKSFSKEFSLEGWRLGYAIAPEEVTKKIIKFLQITATNVPEFIQAAGAACLDNEDEILTKCRHIWKSRADAAIAPLREAGFRFADPDAGIYVFMTHDKIQDSVKFALELLEEGVVVAPGKVFGGYDNFIRITLNRSEEEIKEALRIIKKFFAKM